MTREETIRQMEGVRSDVDRRTEETLLLVLALVEKYRHLGKAFTFGADKELDDEVNALLVSLSDSLRADADRRARAAVDDALPDTDNEWDDVEEFLDRRQGKETRVERYDLYCSRLKSRWETWIAIGFAYGLRQTEIAAEIRKSEANPASSQLWKEAAEDGGFQTGLLPDESLGYGRGVSKNLTDGLTLTGQQAINEAFQFVTLLLYAKMPHVTGYRVHRGSSFDCPYCDELCVGIHPIDEMVLPAHPRCMCWTTPVYSGEEEGG